MYAPAREVQHNFPQTIETACEPVHTMRQKKITFAEVFESSLQLWPVRVLARRFIGEHLVELNSLKLAFRGLINATYSAVPDPFVVPFSCHHPDSPRSVYLDSRPFPGYVKKTPKPP